MRLFITGGSGFVGAAVVGTALERGHEVVAMVRPATSIAKQPWAEHPGLSLARGDLRRRGDWEAGLDGCDAVIHLAAIPGGDFFTQFNATVLGTENLLAAMAATAVRRLVHISTFSMYDYRAIPDGSVLDESSPIEARPLDRDEYLQTKIIQEQMVRDFASEHGGELTVIRPGAIYGPNNRWDAGRVLRAGGKYWVAFGRKTIQKLTYVDNCAEAIVLAAERREAIGETINILDDDLPTQAEFEDAQRRAGFGDVGSTVSLPLSAVRLVDNTLAALNKRFYDGKAKLPAFAMPAKMESQYRPLRYTNAKAKRVLGWTPRYSLDDALRRIREAEVAGRAR